MVNKVFGRWFAHYQPAIVAICDELADEPSRVINKTTRRFNHVLRPLPATTSTVNRPGSSANTTIPLSLSLVTTPTGQRSHTADTC